jgi:hypothetical protein
MKGNYRMKEKEKRRKKTQQNKQTNVFSFRSCPDSVLILTLQNICSNSAWFVTNYAAYRNWSVCHGITAYNTFQPSVNQSNKKTATGLQPGAWRNTAKHSATIHIEFSYQNAVPSDIKRIFKINQKPLNIYSIRLIFTEYLFFCPSM